MKFNNTRFFFCMANFDRAVQCAIATIGPDGRQRLAAVDQLVFRELGDDELLPTALSMTRDAAQSIVDELHRLGFRPTNREAPEGELAAVKYHLEDMRRLAFREDKNA